MMHNLYEMGLDDTTLKAHRNESLIASIRGNSAETRNAAKVAMLHAQIEEVCRYMEFGDSSHFLRDQLTILECRLAALETLNNVMFKQEA